MRCPQPMRPSWDVGSLPFMRWQELFADLEGHAEALERADTEGEAAERARYQVGQVRLVNRLRAQVGQVLVTVVLDVGAVRGRLERVGADWLLLATPTDVVVPMWAVAGVRDLRNDAVHPDGVSVVESRLTMTSVMRGIARDRSQVRIVLADSTTVHGTPDRVGADAVDLAEHDSAEPPRQAAVQSRLTVAFPAIRYVQRRSTGW